MLTNLEKALFLEDIDLFSQVTLEQLSYLAGITREISVPPGRLLYAEGDAPDGLYIVISGAVRLSRSNQAIDRIEHPGTFGVWALIDDGPRLATAEALQESRLLFIPRDDFYDVLADHVEMVGGLLKHLVRRLRNLAVAAEKDA